MIQGEQLQLLVEATKDRIVGIPGIHSQGLVPLNEPGIEAIIYRDINRTVAEIENLIKLSLSPKRKTDLPKTPREAYENKSKYSLLGCFPDANTVNYPRWSDLDDKQKSYYAGDPNLYVEGTLDWDLLRREQRIYLTQRISFVPNKSGDAERYDGKGRTYIKLYQRQLIKVERASIEVPNPGNPSFPLLSRAYTPSEIIMFKREGGIQLMPSFGTASMLAGGGAYLAKSAVSYGLGIPSLPQILKVDYTYGLEEIPLDLQEAVALKTAIKTFESINLMTTQGMLSFAVQGFNAAFGEGMYVKTMERYDARAAKILESYRMLNITGW